MKTFNFSLLFGVLFFVSCAHQIPENQTKDKAREPASTYSPPLRFETCSDGSERNYLVDQILAMPPEYYQKAHYGDWSSNIPMRCVQVAQRNYGGGFALCAGPSAAPKAAKLKPCMSEAYTTLTYNAYQDVMDCFNLDPKDFFLQIMIESGFHVNAFNKKGKDSGITQFTGNGLQRIAANNLVERTRTILLESSRPSCQRISSVVGSFDSGAFEVKNRCSVIALPRNPYRAMFFNYLHTMLDQISVESIVDDIPEIKNVMNDKIKRNLVYLAYNRGLTGARRLLDGYVKSRKAVGHEIVSDDLDLVKNLTDVKRVLSSSSWKRDKLKTSKKITNLSFAEYAVINDTPYLSDMVAADEYTKKLLGDECGGL